MVKRFGVAGTGVPIRELWGVAADNAARAALANGPKASGGHGVAGGNKVLMAVKAVPVAIIGVGALALFVVNARRETTVAVVTDTDPETATD